jgi:hypothetical protein
MSLAMQRWTRLSTWTAVHIGRTNYSVWAIGVVVLAWLRVGLGPVLPFEPGLPRESYLQLPEDWTATTFGWRLLAFAFQPMTIRQVNALTVLVSLILVLLVVLAVRAGFRENAKLGLVVILTITPGAVLLRSVGSYDVFTLAGGLIFGLVGFRVRWAILGVVLMMLGNPEQTSVALSILLLISFTRHFQPWRRNTLWALALAAPAAILLNAIALQSGITARAGTFILAVWLEQGVANFLGYLPLHIYAAYALAWIFVAIALLSSGRRDLVILVVALIIIPFAIQTLTLDQTRVIMGVIAPASAALGVIFLPQVAEWAERSKVVGWQTLLIILAFMLPPVIFNPTLDLMDIKVWSGYPWLLR